jgi:hypothetical protein
MSETYFTSYAEAHAYAVTNGRDVEFIQTVTYWDGRRVFGVLGE